MLIASLIACTDREARGRMAGGGERAKGQGEPYEKAEKGRG